VEKTLTENRDRLPADDVRRIESAIAGLREAAQGDDAEAIRRAIDVLQKAAHGMAEQLYKQQASSPGDRATERNDDVKEGVVVDA